ncbi:MAG: helicase-associated domain-containing protein [Anaerolineae bacterium]|nr:helicase-associated domain-containing protein [Anaerolineae bacterium]
MRTLTTALTDHELVTLRVIGEWWDLDLTGADKTRSVKEVAAALERLDMEKELAYLAPEEAAAVRALAAAGGRIPVGTFTRSYGDVRQMGPGRLEREEPWLDPASPAESLWYRGFLYRAFDQDGDADALVEYFYLPHELFSKLPQAETQQGGGRSDLSLQPSDEPGAYDPETTTAVDDMASCLAIAQRAPLDAKDLARLRPYLFSSDKDRLDLLLTLGMESGYLREHDDGQRPTRTAVEWLRLGREQQLRALAEAWSASSWNDLCHTPGLACEGSGWNNDPIAARTALFDHLPRDEHWYRLDDLVAVMSDDDPDFQRPEGNYDTWYIRDLSKDRYLRGFENWDLVEGRLLRFLVCGPMYWLGLAECGDGLYRLTGRALDWLANRAPGGAGVRVPLVIQPDATLLVPHNADRYQRFQVARVAVPLPLQRGEPYRYRLTPGSLQRARESGIQPERILKFLHEASTRPVPASVRRAVERWAAQGLEGQLEPAVILRVRNAAILDTLQSNPKTRPYIGERLGELAALIRGDWQAFQQLTATLGLLLDAVGEDGE